MYVPTLFLSYRYIILSHDPNMIFSADTVEGNNLSGLAPLHRSLSGDNSTDGLHSGVSPPDQISDHSLIWGKLWRTCRRPAGWGKHRYLRDKAWNGICSGNMIVFKQVMPISFFFLSCFNVLCSLSSIDHIDYVTYMIYGEQRPTTSSGP